MDLPDRLAAELRRPECASHFGEAKVRRMRSREESIVHHHRHIINNNLTRRFSPGFILASSWQNALSKIANLFTSERGRHCLPNWNRSRRHCIIRSRITASPRGLAINAGSTTSPATRNATLPHARTLSNSTVTVHVTVARTVWKQLI